MISSGFAVGACSLEKPLFIKGPPVALQADDEAVISMTPLEMGL